MADIRFKKLYKPLSDALEISQDFILYFDENGTQWTVPLGTGHWIERDILAPWLAAGHTPEHADQV